MVKPTSHLGWGVGNADPAQNIIEPTGAKKSVAWTQDERPPYELMNWLFFRQDEWNKYFEQTTDALVARYDLVIGAGPEATHATLQAAVNDGAIGADQWVLVQDDLTVNTIITLTKARWRIDFSPGVVYTRGSVAKAFQLGAEGIEIFAGRFVGWSVASDIVFEQLVAAEYCKIIGSRFGVGTDTEVDQSAVPAGKAGPVSQTISEV